MFFPVVYGESLEDTASSEALMEGDDPSGDGFCVVAASGLRFFVA